MPALSVVLAGCAQFRDGRLDVPENAPVTERSVTVEISRHLTAMGNDVDWRDPMQRGLAGVGDLSARCTAGLEAAGLVTRPGVSPELWLQIDLHHRLSMSPWFWLTSITLFLVPSSLERDDVDVEVLVTDMSSGATQVLKRGEQVSMWWGLFVVFAMPFTGGNSVDQITFDACRSAGLELQ